MNLLHKTCKIRSKTEKGSIYIRNSLGTKFQLELTVFNFWTTLTQKGLIFKTKNMKITIQFYIFELVEVQNFNLNKQYWFFETNFTQKGYFRSKAEKNENHRWIFHIQIWISTEFQLKVAFKVRVTYLKE